jgi:hypothetical protein|tara:strand:+ start:2586 stop:2897 length:312 start_codon:yes stop_codon:yes gene_type:complete
LKNEGDISCEFRPFKKRKHSKIETMFGNDEDRRPPQDGPIHTDKILADRKIFFLDLKENDRGQFVKITEDVRGRRDTIMVPTEFLDDFITALQDIRDASDLED